MSYVIRSMWLAADGKGAVRNLGKPVELAHRYYLEGADEVTFLNITSFRDEPLKDAPMLKVTHMTYMPQCLCHLTSY